MAVGQFFKQEEGFKTFSPLSLLKSIYSQNVSLLNLYSFMYLYLWSILTFLKSELSAGDDVLGLDFF